MSISFQDLKSQPILTNTASAKTTHIKSVNDVSDSNSGINKKNNTAKKLALALSGLAVLGVSVIYFCRNKKKSPVITTEAVTDYMQNNLLQTQDLNSYLDSFLPKERDLFAQILSELKEKQLSFANCIKNKENSIDFLNQLFAMNKAKSNNFHNFPSVLYFSKLNNNLRKNIAQIIADYYGAGYKQTKYTKGYLKEFIQTLEEYFNNTQTKFLYIDDIEPFIEDLNKSENIEFLNIFKNIIKKEKNNTMLVLNKDLDNKIFERKQINFDFSDDINKFNFEKELTELAYKAQSKTLALDLDIAQDIKIYTDQRSSLGLSEKSSKNNIWLFENNKDNYIDKFMNTITSRTDDSYQKVSLGSDLKNVIAELKQRLLKSQEFFDRTEHKTYLYIDDIGSAIKDKENSPEFKELSDILKTAKDSHLTVILDKNNDSSFEKLIENNSQIKTTSFDLKKIRENLLDFESLGKGGNRLRQWLEIFTALLDIEKGGRKILNCNGILLYGDAQKIEKAQNIIKNTLDVNFKEAKYDPKQPFESIKKMAAIAEKGEAEYPRTKKRTMINLIGWDELLTNEELIENRKMIARFKQFVEHCSERYHTTVLMKTSRSLDDFEDASMASHRFETKIKLKD